MDGQIELFAIADSILRMASRVEVEHSAKEILVVNEDIV